MIREWRMALNFTLTLIEFQNLTPTHDFVSPLREFNLFEEICLVLFEIVTPLSLLFNLFVFVSCLAILFKSVSQRVCRQQRTHKEMFQKEEDRHPSLVFIGFNSLLDILTSIVDALVITKTVDPQLATAVSHPNELPTLETLVFRCQIEKGDVYMSNHYLLMFS